MGIKFTAIAGITRKRGNLMNWKTSLIMSPMFEADGAGGAGAGAGAAGAGDTGAGAGAGVGGDAGKTFTQADIDKIIADRLTRERSKYADYDSLKAMQADYEKLKEANMTEQEKVKAQAEKATKEAADFKAKYEQMVLTQAKANILKSLGLPEAFANRLQGSTEDELKADAEALKVMLGGQIGQAAGNGQSPQVGGSSNPAGNGGNNNPVDYRQANTGDFKKMMREKFGIRL